MLAGSKLRAMSLIGKPPCDDGAVLYGCRAAAGSAVSRRWTLVAAILGSSMAFVDGTIANVALPAIQRDLDATASQAQWVIESYAMFLASLLLVGGALGDRFGRRTIFLAGVAIFTVAAIGCALSASVQQLIVARAVQGVGAALLVPGSLALISATFPKAERGQAIGTWSGFSGIAAALGPVIGGFLVDQLSWTWAFLINVPLGIALIVLSLAKVPESRSPPAAAGLDVAGALLAMIGPGRRRVRIHRGAGARLERAAGGRRGRRSDCWVWRCSSSSKTAPARRCCRSACSGNAIFPAPTCSPCCCTRRWAGACISFP